MAGPPLITPALVLGALRYSETSRIVRLATRDHGMVSAMAKGALRPRSRFGAALQLLSEGHAHLLLSRNTELHTLAAFDLVATHGETATNLDRFAAAMALAEVATHFVPPTPNPPLYHQLRADLLLIERAPADAIGTVALRALWRLIAELGLGPVLTSCARDGAPLPSGAIAFALREGGFVCATCARAGVSTRLGEPDRADLVALVTGGDVPLLDRRQHAAHRRLLLRWVREHLGDSAMPALEAWTSAA